MLKNLSQNKKISFPLLTILLFVLIYGSLFASVFFWRGGYIWWESRLYLLNYTDHRPLIQKIFNVALNDMGFYQARELSYFFDYLDANFIKMSIHAGFPHFYSLNYYLSLIIIINLLLLISFNYFKQKSLTIFSLISMLLFTSPLYFFGGVFLRSGKYLLVTFFSLLIWLFLLDYKNHKKGKLLKIFIFVLAFAISMIDRQGYFLIIALMIILLSLRITTGIKKFVEYFLILLSIFLISSIYAQYIGPWLIDFTTGQRYNPTTTMNLSFLSTRREFPSFKDSYPNPYMTVAKNASNLFIDTISYVFGNLSRPITLITSILLLIATGYAIYIRNKHSQSKQFLFIYGQLVFLSIFLLWIMLYLMLVKHPPIALETVRRNSYYTVLITIAGLYFINFAIGQILTTWPKLKPYIIAILFVLLISNISALPKHINIVFIDADPIMKIYYQSGPHLINILKSKDKLIDDPVFANIYFQKTGMLLDYLTAKLKE